MARKKRSLKARSRDAIVNRTLDVDQESNSRNYRARGDYMINPDLENVRHEKPRCYSGVRPYSVYGICSTQKHRVKLYSTVACPPLIVQV